MKRYSIMGISLVDFSAREALRLAERFLRSGVLNTATYLTSSSLGHASKDEEVRELIQKTDLVLCVQPDIIEAGGAGSAARIREIEERVFLREFLRKMARGGFGVFLLAETQLKAQELKDSLTEVQEDLCIAGCKGYEEFDRQPERLLNALNDAAPKVILSQMTWPLDLKLMHNGRKFLNAELWIALPEKKLSGAAKPGVLKSIRKKIFQKRVNKYNEEKAD